MFYRQIGKKKVEARLQAGDRVRQHPRLRLLEFWRPAAFGEEDHGIIRHSVVIEWSHLSFLGSSEETAAVLHLVASAAGLECVPRPCSDGPSYEFKKPKS